MKSNDIEGNDLFKNPNRRIPRSMLTTSLTAAKSTARYPWIEYSDNRMIDKSHIWVFVDGSSNGWHSAVIIDPGHSIRSMASFVEKTPMRNVSGELDALLLGLNNIPKGRKAIIVHDYIGIGAWMVGAWRAKKEGIRRRLRDAKQIISDRYITVRFIHHGGHQKDKTDFTYWNNKADGLCSDSVEHDSTVYWEKVSDGDK